MVRVRVQAAALAAGLICGACGGGGSGGGLGITTGLPSTEQLSTLSDADAMKACMMIAQGFNSLFSETEQKRVTCVQTALGMSVTADSQGNPVGNVSKCQSIVDSCVNSSTDAGVDAGIDLTGLGNNIDCTQAMAAELKGCSATVAEYEACMNALAAELQSQVASINCAALSDLQKLESMSSGGVDVASLPACTTLQAKCPNFDFSGGSMSSTDSTDTSSSSSSGGAKK